MAKDSQLIHVTVDEARLKGASNRVRNQFVGCMHAHNKLTTLNRLLMFTMNDTGDGELHNSAQSVQMTTDPLVADVRNFYKVEKWTRDGTKVDSLLYAATVLGGPARCSSEPSNTGRGSVSQSGNKHGC
jgi:hypothetical protein